MTPTRELLGIDAESPTLHDESAVLGADSAVVPEATGSRTAVPVNKPIQHLPPERPHVGGTAVFVLPTMPPDPASPSSYALASLMEIAKTDLGLNVAVVLDHKLSAGLHPHKALADRIFDCTSYAGAPGGHLLHLREEDESLQSAMSRTVGPIRSDVACVVTPHGAADSFPDDARKVFGLHVKVIAELTSLLSKIHDRLAPKPGSNSIGNASTTDIRPEALVRYDAAIAPSNDLAERVRDAVDPLISSRYASTPEICELGSEGGTATIEVIRAPKSRHILHPTELPTGQRTSIAMELAKVLGVDYTPPLDRNADRSLEITDGGPATLMPSASLASAGL